MEREYSELIKALRSYEVEIKHAGNSDTRRLIVKHVISPEGKPGIIKEREGDIRMIAASIKNWQVDIAFKHKRTVDGGALFKAHITLTKPGT